MSIQRGEHAWRGTHAYDLAEYLESDGGKVIQPTCDCGNRGFHVACNFDAGGAQATCANCGAQRELARSSGTPLPQLDRLICECRADVFELGVTVERTEDGTWVWKSLGFRCPKCGLLGACENRRQTVAFGEPAPLMGFADPDRDR